MDIACSLSSTALRSRRERWRRLIAGSGLGRAETPDGFVFSLKGPRFVTHRNELASAGDALQLFFSRGVLELGDKLGPVLWQFAPFKPFDGADFARFLNLLPREIGGRAILRGALGSLASSSTTRSRAPPRRSPSRASTACTCSVQLGA